MTHKNEGIQRVLDSIGHYYSTLSFAMQSYFYQALIPSLSLADFTNFKALAICGLFCSPPFSILQQFLNHQIRQEDLSDNKILSINLCKFFTALAEIMCLSLLGAYLFNLNVTKMMILNLLSFCMGTFVRLLIDFAFYLLEPKYLVQNNQFFIKNMFDQYHERLSMNQKIIDSFKQLIHHDFLNNLSIYLLRSSIQILLFLSLGLFFIDVSCGIYPALGFGVCNYLINSSIFYYLRHLITVSEHSISQEMTELLSYLSNAFLLFSCVGIFGAAHSFSINLAMVTGAFMVNQFKKIFELINHSYVSIVGEEVAPHYLPDFY